MGMERKEQVRLRNVKRGESQTWERKERRKLKLVMDRKEKVRLRNGKKGGRWD